MFWTNHGPIKNEKSLAHLSSCGKSSEIKEAREQLRQGGKKLSPLSEERTKPRGEYNAEKDALFYEDAPDMFFGLTDNQFAIFYPEDIHALMIGEGVIKVRI